MRVLDLFCGAGGAGLGYLQSGATALVGVDRNPQPDYPGEFLQGDALALGLELLETRDFDFVHASPPCQANSVLTKCNRTRAGWSDTHVDLIPHTRELLEAFGVPYVIENVKGAVLRKDPMLCGEMFGLGVIRHRYFEFGNGATIPSIAHKPHRGRTRGWNHGVYHDGPYLAVYGQGGGKGSVAEWQVAMGIHHTENRRSIAEAIPPAYTKFIASAQRNDT